MLMSTKLAFFLVAFVMSLRAVPGILAFGSAPTAPTNLQAVVVQDQLLIALLWEDNADNETSYKVERSTSGAAGPWSVIATLPADTTQYGDSGLQDGVRYWYRVGAANTAGTSYSSVVSGTASALPVPPTAMPSANSGTAGAAPVVGVLPTTGAGGSGPASPLPWFSVGVGALLLGAAGGVVLARRTIADR